MCRHLEQPNHLEVKEMDLGYLLLLVLVMGLGYLYLPTDFQLKPFNKTSPDTFILILDLNRLQEEDMEMGFGYLLLLVLVMGLGYLYLPAFLLVRFLHNLMHITLLKRQLTSHLVNSLTSSWFKEMGLGYLLLLV